MSAQEAEHSLETISLAIVLLASTNAGDSFVLVGLFTYPELRSREVVTGQYIGV
jgi:hypothetical protein